MPLSLPSADALRAIVAPLVGDVTRAFGSTVTLYRRASDGGAGASGTNDGTNRTHFTGWIAVRAGIACRLEVEKLDELREVFGADAAGDVRGTWSTFAAAAPAAPALGVAELRAYDYAVVVTAGFLAGTRYLLLGAVPRDVEATAILSLASTAEAVP